MAKFCRLSFNGRIQLNFILESQRFEPAGGDLHLDAQSALSDLIAAVGQLTEIGARTGRDRPTVIT